jgi:chorismate dehydratase
MSTQAAALRAPSKLRHHTLGVVSFLNARPLVDPLSRLEYLTIKPDVPSRLAAMLLAGECDAALMPIVDFHRNRNLLRPICDACIASDGETMTVRVYSRVPPDRLRRLHVDGDSHTSVILARVIWNEIYGIRLGLIQEDSVLAPSDPREVEAVLRIGDKVVTDVPRGFGFEVDLGAAWKHLTGLPFVFAAWYGPQDADFGELPSVLESARDAGVAEAERIARERASLHGWPQEMAVSYLRDFMKYRITPPMRDAMGRFFAMAQRRGLLK